jgi:Sec-independent protein translocase protein TatA
MPMGGRSFGVGARELKKAASEEDDENQAKESKETNKAEARGRGEKTEPSQQADARPEEKDVRAEPDSRT